MKRNLIILALLLTGCGATPTSVSLTTKTAAPISSQSRQQAISATAISKNSVTALSLKGRKLNASSVDVCHTNRDHAFDSALYLGAKGELFVAQRASEFLNLIGGESKTTFLKVGSYKLAEEREGSAATFTFDAGISLEEYTGLFVSKERFILHLPNPANAVVGKANYFFFKQ